MVSKTIVLAGGEEIRADYGGGANVWIRNDGTATVYASTTPEVVAGADGVVSIPAGQAVRIDGACGTVYLLGTGSVQLVAADYVACPFKTSAQSGGSGADEVARAAIEAHSGNTEIHVTAAQKTAWDGKADKSDIPDIPESLPANGGNADTLGGRASTDFANAYNFNIGEYLSGRSGDIRELAYLLPTGGLNVSTDSVPDVIFPLTGDLLLIWSKSLYTGNDLMYGTLMVRPMTADGDTYICSVFNGSRYTSWQKLSDGGNAASVGAYTEEKIAALEARVTALEGGT